MEDEELEEETEKDIFENLRFDYKKAKEAKTIIDNLIVEWSDLYDGKKLGNENPQKSQIVMKEVAKQIEWQKPALMEPFTSTSNPIRIKTGKNQNRSRIMQKYLNGQFAGEFDREEFMDGLTDVLLREGTVWIRTGWNYKEEKKTKVIPNATMQDLLQSEEEPSGIKENKDGTFRVKYKKVDILKNIPTLEVCRNEHIFPDPSARTMDECRFVIYKKYMTLSELRQAKIYDEKKLDRLESKFDSESKEDTGLGSVRDADARDYGYDSTYKPKDSARQKIAILEYWGFYDLDKDGIAEPIVATFTEKWGCNLHIGENPYPSKNIPFFRAVYSARSFSLWGNALAYFIGDNQRVKSGFMRGILDNMSLANNGQKFVQRGALDYVNFKRLRNGEKHIIVNKPDAITDGSYNNLPPSVFATMEMINQETKELTGNTAGGNQFAQKDQSEDNPAQLTMSQQRIAGTVRNIANVLGKSLKEWLLMAEVFLTNEQIEQMFSEQEAQDILSFEEAKFAQTSVRVGTEVIRSMRVQQLNMLMQQSKSLGEKTPPDTISALTAEMFELFDMYEKAEEIRNYKPEPNPMAIKMQELEVQKSELENMKLQVEIENLKSQASLNNVDAQATVVYKQAQANEKEAKTQAIKVDTALRPVEVMNANQKNKGQ
jgi:hypothetical protein